MVEVLADPATSSSHGRGKNPWGVLGNQGQAELSHGRGGKGKGENGKKLLPCPGCLRPACRDTLPNPASSNSRTTAELPSQFIQEPLEWAEIGNKDFPAVTSLTEGREENRKKQISDARDASDSICCDSASCEKALGLCVACTQADSRAALRGSLFLPSKSLRATRRGRWLWFTLTCPSGLHALHPQAGVGADLC